MIITRQPCPTTLSVVNQYYLSHLILNRIYAGAYNDLWCYEENERSTLQFYFLASLINDKMADIDEILKIYKTSFDIVFQSFKALFNYHDRNIDIIYELLL